MRVQALGDVVEITVERRLLPRDVATLEARLRPLKGAVAALVVDLAEARGLDDCVVAALADAVRRVAPSVEFRGLSLHHRRLLRYLGLDAAELRQVSQVP